MTRTQSSWACAGADASSLLCRSAFTSSMNGLQARISVTALHRMTSALVRMVPLAAFFWVHSTAPACLPACLLNAQCAYLCMAAWPSFKQHLLSLKSLVTEQGLKLLVACAAALLVGLYPLGKPSFAQPPSAACWAICIARTEYILVGQSSGRTSVLFLCAYTSKEVLAWVILLKS